MPCLLPNNPALEIFWPSGLIDAELPNQGNRTPNRETEPHPSSAVRSGGLGIARGWNTLHFSTNNYRNLHSSHRCQGKQALLWKMSSNLPCGPFPAWKSIQFYTNLYSFCRALLGYGHCYSQKPPIQWMQWKHSKNNEITPKFSLFFTNAVVGRYRCRTCRRWKSNEKETKNIQMHTKTTDWRYCLENGCILGNPRGRMGRPPSKGKPA